jgi:DNA-directed RNA polymerase specialized sigma24 family protein
MGEVSAEKGPARGKATWTLSRQSFERLLAVLDTEPQKAAERYEALRRKLTKLFQWRGCARPEELADATFDRVARRLEEGAQVAPGDVSAYLHGVAVHVAQEHWREVARERALPEQAAAVAAARSSTPDAGRDRRLDCLDECLSALPAGSRALLQRYHAEGEGAQIAARKALAREQGLTPLALRLRVFRLRTALAACVTRCLGRGQEGRETEPGPRA